jgi:hypothetical protein
MRLRKDETIHASRLSPGGPKDAGAGFVSTDTPVILRLADELGFYPISDRPDTN